MVDEVLSSLDKQSGTSFYSYTHRLTIDRGQLIISPVLNIETELLYFHGEETVSIADKSLDLRLTENINFKADKNFAYVDANLLIFPLVIRYRQDGDRFKPLGMKSFKKLSDFFVDEKVPLPQKDKIPLLINGNGQLIWVVGMRQDERYKVSVTTKKVAIFELSNL
ncbi:tRNA(Ile)-lysidine synthase [compost metagenome]